jgi:hypothetical protein
MVMLLEGGVGGLHGDEEGMVRGVLMVGVEVRY